MKFYMIKILIFNWLFFSFWIHTSVVRFQYNDLLLATNWMVWIKFLILPCFYSKAKVLRDFAFVSCWLKYWDELEAVL